MVHKKPKDDISGMSEADLLPYIMKRAADLDFERFKWAEEVKATPNLPAPY